MVSGLCDSGTQILLKMTIDKGDPRSKIVVNAPPLRKCMGEKKFDVVVGEAVMGSKFELNI